jgi:hypothetical protein
MWSTYRAKVAELHAEASRWEIAAEMGLAKTTVARILQGPRETELQFFSFATIALNALHAWDARPLR